MAKKILSVAGIIIILILTGAVSFDYGYRLKKEVKVPGLETSKLIKTRSAVVSGEIIEILGRSITLAAGGDTLAIPIRERTQVRVGSKPMEFEGIKVGDRAEIVLQLRPDNFFEGTYIMVFPETTAP